MKVLVIFALLVAVCTAAKYAKEEEPKPVEGDAHYEFELSVNDEDSKVELSHKESRDKDQTSGVYKVLLPDGAIQTVTYIVDGDNGYVAKVETTEAESEEEEDEKEENKYEDKPKKCYN